MVPQSRRDSTDESIQLFRRAFNYEVNSPVSEVFHVTGDLETRRDLQRGIPEPHALYPTGVVDFPPFHPPVHLDSLSPFTQPSFRGFAMSEITALPPIRLNVWRRWASPPSNRPRYAIALAAPAQDFVPLPTS